MTAAPANDDVPLIWLAEGQEVYGCVEGWGATHCVAFVNPHAEFTPSEGERWARIIAAAPDLLVSLGEVSHMLMSRPDIAAKLRPLMGFAEKAIFERAAAAIAKAQPR